MAEEKASATFLTPSLVRLLQKPRRPCARLFRESAAVLGLLDTNKQHLMRRLRAEMQQTGTLRLSQVVDARLEHPVLLLADGPGRSLRGLVHRAVHFRGGVHQAIVVIAANDSVL